MQLALHFFITKYISRIVLLVRFVADLIHKWIGLIGLIDGEVNKYLSVPRKTKHLQGLLLTGYRNILSYSKSSLIITISTYTRVVPGENDKTMHHQWHLAVQWFQQLWNRESSPLCTLRYQIKLINKCIKMTITNDYHFKATI